MELFGIKYTNKLTGLNESYMNIGFESIKAAERELGSLKREAAKKVD